MPPTPQAVVPQKKSASLSNRRDARKVQIYGSSAGLDLNPSAYSRTDPIKALNVLLKLLTSLPSRIGRGQYKFTPAEQALSLDLVSIIDPFVCHGARTLLPNHPNSRAIMMISGSQPAPPSLLVDQPTEIIDAILFHVDSRNDLLNIGLVCNRLHDIVFPRHFDYRVIQCKVSSLSVWNHLIMHKSLARNVRKLEILDERVAVSGSFNTHQGHRRRMLIPRRISQRDTDLDSTDDELRMHSKQEKYLAAALMRMTGLKEFKWSCNHSPISIAHIWPTLMSRATHLSSLDICDNLLFVPRLIAGAEGDLTDSSESDLDGGEDLNVQSFSVLMARLPSRLPEMTNVVFRSTHHSYGAAKQPELSRVSKMLHQCAKLKSLEITYVPPRTPGNNAGGQTSQIRPLADDFLMYSRWPSTLTNLVLTNLRCTNYTSLATFLSEHPSIEALHLDINWHNGISSSSGCRLPEGSLPHLREIKSSKEHINAILECPCDPPRPLESIKGFKLSGHPLHNVANTPGQSRTIPDVVFLSNLRSKASSVRRIELAGWNDMDDIRKLLPSIPMVQHLDLGKRLGVVNRRNAEKGNGGSTTGPASNVIEWIELLSTLPKLSTLHGVKFFYEVPATPTDAAYLSATHSCDASTGPSSSRVVFPTPGGRTSGCTSSAKAHPSVASNLGQISMMERSRMRKNDEIAGVLAWKCGKLRWVDHWEEGSSKIIQLVRDHHGSQGDDSSGRVNGKDKVRWEVRRVKG